ncbi:MAG: 16S rRNA (adenine(1518)-N(6)/adenine(1519)-N(6))-dimethyltransferase RsmA, partial [Lentisphaerota bacterium]
QNFLIDVNILQILMDAAQLTTADQVLEVGPGLGVLTERLIRSAGKVVAVEKDKHLVRFLEQRFAGTGNLELITGDILDQDLDGLMAQGITRLVANLPYSIASRMLVEFLLRKTMPGLMVITIQKEVADRLRAVPCTKDYGLLGILTQLRCKIRIVKTISRMCFYPPPEVASAIVSLEILPDPVDAAAFHKTHKLVKACFNHRRKQMQTILHQDQPDRGERMIAKLVELGYTPASRPEEITPPDWLTLATVT